MTAAANAQKDQTSISPSNANFAVDALARIAFIRAFEAKSLSLTQTNPPRIVGSVHLCAGHEAILVGAVAGLHEDDQILSTYRGQGWALASGLDSRAVMAEICQRAEGINGDRAGSAYLMAPNTRFIGENGIVGAGPSIACGVAMANLAKTNGRVVVAAIGDAAMNQGAVYEAFSFAALRKLPVIFVVENNGWSEMTATSVMFSIQRLAQRGGGFGIPSATIDGTDPIVVRDSFAVTAQRGRNGEGPGLLGCRVGRMWAHSNRDIEHYRPWLCENVPSGATGAVRFHRDVRGDRMKRFVEGTDRKQATLFPECLEDWIDEDNPVRVIDAFVDRLDLSELGFEGVEPAETGRPAYHPSILLKLYVYGYLNRVQSSRRLEREAGRNVEVMWLLGRLIPDHKTIDDFWKDSGHAISKVCARFVELCWELGLLATASAAIDGRKFKAVNNRDRNLTRAKVERRRAQLEESVARYLSQLDTADRQEPAELLATKTTRLKEKLVKLAEEMRRLDGLETRMLAVPDQQISLTDPDSRSMATSGRG